AVQSDAIPPLGQRIGLRPALFLGLRHHFLLDLLAHLIAHELRDIGNTDHFLLGGRWRCSGLGGGALGLIDQRLRLFLRDNAAFHQQRDQVERRLPQGFHLLPFARGARRVSRSGILFDRFWCRGWCSRALWPACRVGLCSGRARSRRALG